jgi:hypothetical protein
MVDQPTPPSPLTLGAEPERDRLERRVTRMRFALASLRRHANQHRRQFGTTPRQLQQAIAGFQTQILSIEARLQRIALKQSSLQRDRPTERLR